MTSGISRTSQIVVLVSVALAFAGATTLWRRHQDPRRRADRYNVLVISIDTVRRDVLGVYGHRPRHAPGVSTSPALEQLAREGVRMGDAYSTSSWTLPAHISMLTGVPSLVHGVAFEGRVLDGAIPTMAEILRNHGYRTAGIYSGPYLDPYWGFDRGFETYVAAYDRETTDVSQRVAALRPEIEQARAAADWERYDALKRRESQIEKELNTRSEKFVSSDAVTAATTAKLEEFARAGRPWFVFTHFFDAHCDYEPPPPYDTRFDPDYEGTFTGEDCMAGPVVGTPNPNEPGAIVRALGARDLEHAFALYEGEVAWVDDHVAALLRTLDRLGMSARTLVVVTSDHGEEFFEHEGLGHRRTLYEEVVRIPLLLRLPGVLPAGRTVDGPVSLVDVLPTVLDVLGVPYPAMPGSSSFLSEMRTGTRVDHAPLLRTVMMFAGEVRVDAGEPVVLRQLVVQDAFRRGAIKIIRRRSWPQFSAAVAPDVRTILDREAATQYERELLRWIDVERYPDEPLDRYSTDFTAPAARDALAAFHSKYETVLQHRLPRPQTSAMPEHVRQKLESLGYVKPSDGPTFPEPSLALPPP